MVFNDLIDLEIKHELITIRRYQESDFAGLEAIFNPDFFTWFFTNYRTCQEFVEEKLNEFNKQSLVMYVIIDNKTNMIIGTSSLYEFSFRHKRIEMGSSWLSKDYHGSHYNALTKFLLIDKLINQLGFNRIQWKTDALNERSKAAMTKLGFAFEGVLHRHAVTYTGRVRDSLVFAVTDLSWGEVSKIILTRLDYKKNRCFKQDSTV